MYLHAFYYEWVTDWNSEGCCSFYKEKIAQYPIALTDLFLHLKTIIKLATCNLLMSVWAPHWRWAKEKQRGALPEEFRIKVLDKHVKGKVYLTKSEVHGTVLGLPGFGWEEKCNLRRLRIVREPTKWTFKFNFWLHPSLPFKQPLVSSTNAQEDLLGITKRKTFFKSFIV